MRYKAVAVKIRSENRAYGHSAATGIKALKTPEKSTMTYADSDRLRILDYLEKYGCQASVEDIISHSGADALRVYSLIMQMSLDGEIDVLERSYFGAPTRIRKI